MRGQSDWVIRGHPASVCAAAAAPGIRRDSLTDAAEAA